MTAATLERRPALPVVRAASHPRRPGSRTVSSAGCCPAPRSWPTSWSRWMRYELDYAIGDAVSRSSSARAVFFSRAPSMTAIGLVWMPLTTLAELPFTLLLEPFGLAEMRRPTHDLVLWRTRRTPAVGHLRADGTAAGLRRPARRPLRVQPGHRVPCRQRDERGGVLRVAHLDGPRLPRLVPEPANRGVDRGSDQPGHGHGGALRVASAGAGHGRPRRHETADLDTPSVDRRGHRASGRLRVLPVARCEPADHGFGAVLAARAQRDGQPPARRLMVASGPQPGQRRALRPAALHVGRPGDAPPVAEPRPRPRPQQAPCVRLGRCGGNFSPVHRLLAAPQRDVGKPALLRSAHPGAGVERGMVGQP